MISSGFIHKTLTAAIALIKSVLLADESSRLPGILQRLDARVKLIITLSILMVSLITHQLHILAMLYLTVLLLAKFSFISIVAFLKRTWILIPLFSLAMIIPSLFSVITPGTNVASFSGLSITKEGIQSASIFAARTLVSVSAAILLSLTTPTGELLKALRLFGVPPLFIMVLGMGYRYMLLLVETVEQIQRGVQSRVGWSIPRNQGQRLAIWHMATLWIRSYAINEQVYHAMISRGYLGEPKPLHQFQMQKMDWIALGVTGFIGIFLIYIQTGIGL